ncbi:MAG: T9SS type A sorting domain-containing protein, partial [Parvicellaceae bacterium]
IAQTLNIAYYPTIYTIYPDRYLEESGQNGSTYANISANIGNHTGSTGVDAGLFSYTGETVACGSLDVQVLVQNKGSQALAAGDITVNVSAGGANIGSATNATALAQWATETVSIPVSLSSAATISIETVAAGDVNTANNTLSQAIGFATPGTGDLTFELTLDQYPSETSWEFSNSSGTVIASGSGYSQNYAVITETLSVSADDCYAVKIIDSYGDGLGGSQWGGTDGAWTITDASGNQLASGSGDFGDENVDKMDMTAGSGPTAINENGINGLSIYPNPFNNIATVSFNVESMERTTIEVINTIGQNVQSIDLGVVSGNQSVKLDATDLPAGFYLINIKSGSKAVTSRVTVNK